MIFTFLYKLAQAILQHALCSRKATQHTGRTGMLQGLQQSAGGFKANQHGQLCACNHCGVRFGNAQVEKPPEEKPAGNLTPTADSFTSAKTAEESLTEKPCADKLTLCEQAIGIAGDKLKAAQEE